MQLKFSKKERSLSSIKLPNLVIAGVVKSGTTSIYSYLSRHRDICPSSVKETCYFSYYRYGKWDKRYSEELEPYQQYLGYFSQCENQKYIMEATPGYFEGGGKLAREIQKTLGDNVKILIVLRDPIGRLFSFFKYKKSMLELDRQLTLAEYISKCQAMPIEQKIKEENDRYWGIDGGFYANYLPDWFDVFGDNLKIMFFDDLKQDPKLLLKDLCQWLEIDFSIYESSSFEVENKSRNYKSQALQKIALLVNNKAEKFWRANQGIKTALRNIYYAVNGQSHQETINEKTLDYLKSIYNPYNRKLAGQLAERGYTDLPSWLAELN